MVSARRNQGGALWGAALLSCALGIIAGTPAAAQVPELAGTAEASGGVGPETAVLAGGCFWGVEAVFEHVRGVSNVVSGYAGGDASTARYEIVGTGTTGHAESVRITYDPAQVSYAQLLRIFFSVAHDPTQLNRQGPDVGPQYRSAIFHTSEAQRQIALAYIEQLTAAKAFPARIATEVAPLEAFYPAEEYHQDFLARNPRHPYIVVHDRPKLEALRAQFPQAYKE